MRIKEFFNRGNADSENSINDQQQSEQPRDRTSMTKIAKNPWYQRLADRSKNLELYLQSIKNAIIQLCKKPFEFKENLSET